MSIINFITNPSRASFSRVFGGAPAKPGETFGVPGYGSSTVISIVTSVTLLFIWWLVTTMGWVKPFFLPSPQSIAIRTIELASTEYSGATLWQHTEWSLYRVFTAFFIAVGLAIPIGIGMGVNRVLRGIFDPPIEFYRPIPPLGYLPLTIIWLGIDDLQKIVLIALAIFAPMALAARAGVRSVSIEQIHAAYSLGANRFQILRYIVLNGAMPEILTGMRIGIGFGWTTLVAAEMVAAQEGLGHMVLTAAEFLDTEVVILGIVMIGVIAYVFDLLMRFIQHKLVPWKGKM